MLMLLVGCRGNVATPTRSLPPTQRPTQTIPVVPSMAVAARTVQVIDEPAVTLPAAPVEEVTLPPVTVLPTATTLPTPIPTPQEVREIVLTDTPNGRQLIAKRIGKGAFKIVLMGNETDMVTRLYQWFEARPKNLPAQFTIWFIEDINPDGMFDVLRNGDADWRSDRPTPFSSAEARALRLFTQDAAFVWVFEGTDNQDVFHHTDPVGAQMEQLLADFQARYGIYDFTPLGRLQNVPGHLALTLADSGIPSLVVGVDTAAFDVVRNLFEHGLFSFFETVTAETNWLTAANTGVWQFTPNSLVHPIALTRFQSIYYLIDGGRVMAIDPRVPDGTLIEILEPGDVVDGVTVLEPIDLAYDKNAIYALDRAGDVYRYEQGAWTLDRYDRPIRDRSSHYFVAMDTSAERRQLLDVSAPLLLRYDDNDDEKRTVLDKDQIVVDVTVRGDRATVLTRDRLYHIDQGILRENVPLDVAGDAWQLTAAGDHFYVLAANGRRVYRIAQDGTHTAFWQFHDQRTISTMWAADDGTLVFAGRDALYFIDDADNNRQVNTPWLVNDNPPHDPARLLQTWDFTVPVGVPGFTQRDYQLPGAPRHYRLGVHEGVDFYWAKGMQIRAAADGVVIRADHDYAQPWPELFAYWRDLSFTQGFTPPEAEDFFRGRQLWIDHGNGIVTRYVHLDKIYRNIQTGTLVAQGVPIAEVGNSGSPSSVLSETEDAHLHFELRIGNGYLGQYLRSAETRYWLRQILR